jgi:hypothetical protein
LIGAKRFGIQNEDDIGYSVAAIPGGYIMAGYSSAPAINGMTLTRLDNIGNSIWSKRYNAGQQSLMAHQRITLDVLSNGYLLSTEATSTTDRLCMYKTDSLGNIDWVHSFMYQFNVYGRAGNAIPTQDGGFACLGTFYNWSSLNGYKIAFIKTDSLGWSGCNEQSLSITGTPVVFPSQNFIFNQTVYNDSTVVTSLNISEGGVVTTECTSVGVMEHPFSFKVDIFPNPFSDKLIIHELKGSSEITIYDISGKLISCTHASAGEITLNTSTLTPGFYLLKITDAQNSFAQKILKVHD